MSSFWLVILGLIIGVLIHPMIGVAMIIGVVFAEQSTKKSK